MKLHNDSYSTTEIEDLKPVQALKNALANNRLSHAILLHGHNESTLEKVAFYLSNLLLKNTQYSNPTHHPDLFAIHPSNKMNQISIDNMRELIGNIQHSPSQGTHKVAIIYHTDRMHIAAANAFLKTLEEPPSDTTLFLITTKIHSLLQTILSRCFQVKIPSQRAMIDDSEWLQWLNTYSSWILNLQNFSTSSSPKIDIIMPLYSMLSQFPLILDRLTQENFSEKQIENLSADEKSILQTALRKRLRNHLFESPQETPFNKTPSTTTMSKN